jgi:hypothetical protein
MIRLLSMHRPLSRFAAAVAVVLALAGCGGYYSAEIAGYIKDAENEGGINGAIIRIYTDEPTTAVDTGFIVETASMASSGNDGYFSHKIVWKNLFPSFGEEGDSGSVWLGISHEDYTDAIVHVQGILSDTVNVVPDIPVDRATFETPELTGRVVDVSGDGVNGVRVVLDLASTADDEEDYITTTATIDGTAGTFRFANVTWRDEEPDSEVSDTESATVTIDDPDYESTSTLSVLLTSGQDSEAASEMSVTRSPRTEFAIQVSGRCVSRVVLGTGENQDTPVRGVDVTLTYLDEAGAVHTLLDQSDANGAFSFYIQWTDTSPRDFDTGTAGTAVPDAADDATVPEGEDGLYIQIQYADTDSNVANEDFPDHDITGANTALYDSADFALKSWINPNYLPDAVIQ